MKHWWRIGLAIMTVLLSGCRDRLVIDRGGIGKEHDVMVAEAVENTRLMEETTGLSE